MEIFEWNGGNNAYGYFLHDVDFALNLRILLFNGGDIDNHIVHYIVYGYLEIHIHKDSMYYHDKMGTYFITILSIYSFA